MILVMLASCVNGFGIWGVVALSSLFMGGGLDV